MISCLSRQSHPFRIALHYITSGASPRFGRGGGKIFFSDLEICMSHGEAMRIAMWVRGHALGYEPAGLTVHPPPPE